MVKRAVALALLLLLAGKAYSCSCGGQGPTPEERIRSSEHIYLGIMTSISAMAEEPAHGHRTKFEVSILVYETWKGTGASQMRGTMTKIYNDPAAEGTIVSSCNTSVSLGWVVVLTSDTRPVFGPCNNNAWMIEETEIDDMREYVSSELEDGPIEDS